MHGANANLTTRKLRSFSPSLCHINVSDEVSEDRDKDLVCVCVCGPIMTGSEVKSATSTHNAAGCYGFETFPLSPHKTFLGSSLT
jgi:hypothetical protein